MKHIISYKKSVIKGIFRDKEVWAVAILSDAHLAARTEFKSKEDARNWALEIIANRQDIESEIINPI